jgi:hypothetical protein
MMRQEDEAACLKLCIEYCHYIDAANFAAFAELFSEDGLLDLPGRRMDGRKAIFDILSKRPASVLTLHFCTNSRVVSDGDDTARGATYVQVFRHEGGGSEALPVPMTLPVSAGIYEDRFARTDLGWRFQSRVLRPFFRAK